MIQKSAQGILYTPPKGSTKVLQGPPIPMLSTKSLPIPPEKIRARKSIPQRLLKLLFDSDPQFGNYINANPILFNLLDTGVTREMKSKILADFLETNSVDRVTSNKLLSIINDINWGPIINKPFQLSGEASNALQDVNDAVGHDVYSRAVHHSLFTDSANEIIKRVFNEQDIENLRNSNISESQVLQLFRGIFPGENPNQLQDTIDNIYKSVPPQAVPIEGIGGPETLTTDQPAEEPVAAAEEPAVKESQEPVDESAPKEAESPIKPLSLKESVADDKTSDIPETLDIKQQRASAASDVSTMPVETEAAIRPPTLNGNVYGELSTDAEFVRNVKELEGKTIERIADNLKNKISGQPLEEIKKAIRENLNSKPELKDKIDIFIYFSALATLAEAWEQKDPDLSDANLHDNLFSELTDLDEMLQSSPELLKLAHDIFKNVLESNPVPVTLGGSLLPISGVTYGTRDRIYKLDKTRHLKKMKTKTGKQLMDELYRFNQFPRGISNTKFSRSFSSVNMEPKIEAAARNNGDNFKKLATDLKHLRKYMRDHRIEKTTL